MSIRMPYLFIGGRSVLAYTIGMKMSDRPKDLRPREKLAAKGAAALSDYELLMAIIGSGTAQADVTKMHETSAG